MSMNAAMRARWAREDDDALLGAHYYGQLTPEGQAVVREVLRERLGEIADIEARARESLGAVVGRITATRLTSGSPGGPLPSMRGVVVFAEGGVGFVPAGRFHDVGGGGFAEAGSRMGLAVGSGLAGFVVGSAIEGALGTAHRVLDRTRSPIPLPILARVDRNAIWIPAQPSGEVTWSGLGGEVSRAGQRCFECDVDSDVTAAVLAWADLVDWHVSEPEDPE